MAGLKLQFTQAGLEQLLSAQDRGLKAEITHMAFGDSAYAPDKSQTALLSEKERIEIADYQGDGQNLRLAGKFEGELEYAIREIGIFLADGTLLGVYSQAGKTLGYRTPVVKILQWFTLNIQALPTDSITVVVGTENLNLILDEEFAQLAEVQINTLHRQMLQEFRLAELEQRFG
ncbi:phage tail protein [Thalassomonas viridans]|uniref:Phage tail protein n=1 Tax=Thalassomonas viridans TaxID=137584 RepID=A0AAE9Z1S9_9GAMM|nr:phage tail protein [Thalassomonas viridans]WDE04672.1 phage tail protein [Thalassomonas viridans]